MLMKIETNPVSKSILNNIMSSNKRSCSKKATEQPQAAVAETTMYSGRHNCPFPCHEQRCCHKATKETTTVK